MLKEILLPNLPRILNRSEASFGLTFRKWWTENPLPGTFELKHSRGKDSIPFAAIEPDQIAFANAAYSKKGTLARVTVGSPGCADYIGLVNSPAWIVIKYPRAFHIISINAFLLESSRSKRRSLTNTRAGEISTISVRL